MSHSMRKNNENVMDGRESRGATELNTKYSQGSTREMKGYGGLEIGRICDDCAYERFGLRSLP